MKLLALLILVSGCGVEQQPTFFTRQGIPVYVHGDVNTDRMSDAMDIVIRESNRVAPAAQAYIEARYDEVEVHLYDKRDAEAECGSSLTGTVVGCQYGLTIELAAAFKCWEYYLCHEWAHLVGGQHEDPRFYNDPTSLDVVCLWDVFFNICNGEN